MQYILSEEEYKMGKQLTESWRLNNLSINQAYERSDTLIKQGYYTVIQNYDDSDPNVFELIVFSED